MIEFAPGEGLEFRPALPSEKDYEILSFESFEHVGDSATPRVSKDTNLLDHTSDHSNPGYDLLLIGDTDGVVLSAADATGALADGHLSRVSDGMCRVVASHPLVSRGIAFDMTSRDLYEYTTLDSYVVGSLARNVADNVVTLIGEKTSAAKPLFSVQNHATSTYTRNTNCWAYPLNLTGMSPWNSRGGNARAGCAFTPCHIILATHFPLAVNDTVRFVTADNVVVTRTITNTLNIADTDTQICLLDSDLPASITPFKFLPSTVENYLPSLDSWSLPVLAFDAQENALCQRTLTLYWTRGPRVGIYGPAEAEPFVRMTEPIVGGDSGNPIFLIINNTPVLLSHWTGQTHGPKYYAFLDEIAAALTTLGGGHSLSTVDLSEFINYTITFNGIDEFLDTGLAMTGWTEFTLFERSTWLSNSGYDIDGFSYPTGGANGEVRMGRSLDGAGLFLGSGSGLDWFVAAISIVVDTETTLALTSKSGGTARAYVNGSQVESRPESTWAITQTQATYLVGGQKEGEVINHFSHKQTKQYEIYNRQLTADEITYLHTKGISGASPGNPVWQLTL